MGLFWRLWRKISRSIVTFKAAKVTRRDICRQRPGAIGQVMETALQVMDSDVLCPRPETDVSCASVKRPDTFCEPLKRNLVSVIDKM